MEEQKPSEDEWIHENEAAKAFGGAMAGEGVRFIEPPREGKIDFVADRSGLFVIDEACLEEFNMIPGVMCASRRNFTPVSSGRDLAGTRAIPLYLHRASFLRAITVLRNGPLFRVLPMRKARVGILVTGSEVFQGLVKDRFIPIIGAKVESLDCQVVKAIIVPDDRKAISDGIRELLGCGTDLLVTTAGLSVDPDDVTRQGLLDAGATDLLHGVPVLPGAMTLLARIGSVQVMGVPACALYFKITCFRSLVSEAAGWFGTQPPRSCKAGTRLLLPGVQVLYFPQMPVRRLIRMAGAMRLFTALAAPAIPASGPFQRESLRKLIRLTRYEAVV